MQDLPHDDRLGGQGLGASHLAHLRVDFDRDLEPRVLGVLVQGVPERRLDVPGAAARGRAHGPVDRTETRNSVSRLGKEGFHYLCLVHCFHFF